MSFGCVVLSGGGRPEGVRAAVESLLAQEGVELDVVVVGNGWTPTGLPEGSHGVTRPSDDGIPAGRNFGVPHAAGDLLLFLDDDATLEGTGALAALAALFAGDARLGMVQPRVEVAGDGPRAREWVPRLRAADPLRSSDATHVWEGCVAIRRAVFEAIGGWPAEFRFVHEGVDLGWRVLDAGYRIRYAADVVARHPPYAERNDWDHYYGARNRVWLARRYLPLPMAIPFVATFAVRTVPRMTSGHRRRAALRGYRDGMRGPGPGRTPLRARTLARMTRLGRPPVL